MAVALEARPARLLEYAAALRLVFGFLEPEPRDQRCLVGLYLIDRGELDPAGLFVVPGSAGLAGAMLCQRLHGAAAVVWPPGVPPGPGQARVEDVLVRHTLAWLKQGGAKLAQALLAPEEIALGAPLLRHGFACITELWQLRHDLGPTPEPTPLDCHPWDEADHQVFVNTLLRTYEGSHDCPELNGVRTPAETIAGHKASGIFDPGRWWLVRDGDRALAVLMLTELPDTRIWDVSYVGVVPEARGRGLGRALMHKALAEARSGGAASLTLAVDARNTIACALYHTLGFQVFERRSVFLTVHP